MIEVTNLSKTYNKGKANEVRANENISITLEDKGLYVIFGKSGAGKTTFMNSIGGLDKFDEGSITFSDASFNSAVSDDFRVNNISYIFQNYCLDPKENVYENVALGLRTLGVKDEELIFNRVMTALTNVNMSKAFKRDVTTLSGGEQQRVSVARAMAKGSNIILADEPTGNLDEYNTHVVMDLLKEMSKNRLVILVTHETEIVEKYADKIIEISDGRIIDEYSGNNFEASSVEKNNIYLKDLSHSETLIDNIKIEQYGDKEELNLKVVSKDGKIYLSTNNLNVKFLDNNSEIKLLDISKEDFKDENKEKVALKVKELEPIKGKGKANVFSFKESFLKAGRGSKKFVVNNVILNIIIIALMVGIIILSGVWGENMHKYNDSITRCEGEIIAVKANETNYKDIESTLNKYSDSIYYRLEPDNKATYEGNSAQYSSVNVRFSNFTSHIYDGISTFQVYVQTRVLDKSLIGDKQVIAGSDIKGKVVVTTGFVDAIRKELEDDRDIQLNTYEAIIGSNIEGSPVCQVIKENISAIYYDEEGLETYYRVNNFYQEQLLETSDNIKDFMLIYRDLSQPITTTINIDDVEYKVRLVPFYDFINENGGILTKEEKENLSTLYNENNVAYTKKTKEILGDRIYLFNARSQYIVYINDLDAYDSMFSELNQITKNVTSTIDMDEKAKWWIKEDIKMLSIVSVALYIGIVLISAIILFVNTLERKKEIGIYKAIGVSKKDILFKYFVENLRNVIIPTFIAIIIIGLMIALIPSGLFIYSWWQFIINLVVLPTALIVINLLAVNRYASKPASKILSDYDV